MYRIRVAVPFEAGHRLLNYVGKCASPHGHSYTAEVFALSETLDTLGLAVDFGDLKAKCRGWIDAHWDHGFLLNDQDAELLDAFGKLSGVKIFLFSSQNPTAEAMARVLCEVVQAYDWNVESVRIWESPSQFAEYVPRPKDISA